MIPATNPNPDTFRPLRTADPALDRLRDNWERSAPDRKRFQGPPLANELDYYYNTASAEISMVLYELSDKENPPAQVKALAERVRQLTDITDGVANFLLRHLLYEL
jgi:hypothetical protein